MWIRFAAFFARFRPAVSGSGRIVARTTAAVGTKLDEINRNPESRAPDAFTPPRRFPIPALSLSYRMLNFYCVAESRSPLIRFSRVGRMRFFLFGDAGQSDAPERIVAGTWFVQSF